MGRNGAELGRRVPLFRCAAWGREYFAALRDNCSVGHLRSISLALLAFSSAAFAQIRDDGPSLIVAGRIESRRLTVTAADIGRLPKKTINVKTEKGTSTFEGVSLQSVLELAGVLFGPKLQGARLMAFVVVEGAPPSLHDFYSKEQRWGDDYRALFALPELDDGYSKQPVILAVTQGGKPLRGPDGPFRIIAPQDSRSTRWIKDVKLIWVLHADSLLGMGSPVR
jgi:hypothetical protein